jgi:transposase-like protein
MNPVCPNCASENVIPIIDGDPWEERPEKASRKGADRGSFLMRKNSPEYVCQDCGTKWTRKRAERRDPAFQSNRTLTER